MGAIAGIFHCGTVKPVDPARVERMCEALAHRGPDDAGVWTAPGVGLGSRSPVLGNLASSARPMASPDGKAVLVLDGTICNHRELRRELRELGADLRTDADGEVILAAWQRWGVDCLRRLHGMFAFALYDREARTLFLARDRLGERPLFLAPLSDGSLAFASELKGLLAHPLLRRDVDPLAIEDYLAWGYVPDHRAILKGVEKLPAGHYRLLRHGKLPVESQRWWDVSFAERRKRPERDLEAELLHHLREAVTSRMAAEGPPAALLSGGIGSESVAALMAEASRIPVRSCSVSFEAAPADRAERAAGIAEMLGCEHAARRLAEDPIAAIDALAAIFDEPFADPLALPAWRLSQLARESTTVALSGDGANEALAGYRRHVFHRHAERLRAVLPSGLRRAMAGVMGGTWPKADWAPQMPRARTTVQALSGSGTLGYARALAVVPPELRSQLYTTELASALGDYRAEQPLASLMDSAPARSGLDRAQYVDLAFGLPGDILTRADRTSMAASLEVRHPLLDHRLVEFAATLPERMRVRGRHGQWLLKRAMRRYLPDDMLYRPAPGLVTPIAGWLRGPLAGEARAIAASAPLARTGWFDAAQLVRLVDAHRAGRADHSRVLWQLLMLDRSLVRLGVIS